MRLLKNIHLLLYLFLFGLFLCNAGPHTTTPTIPPLLPISVPIPVLHWTPIITFYLWFCHAENHLIGWDGDGHDGMDLWVGEVWCQRSGWERCPGGWGKEHPLILVMRKYYGFRDTNTAGTVLANMIWPNSKSFHLALQQRNVGTSRWVRSKSKWGPNNCLLSSRWPPLSNPPWLFFLFRAFWHWGIHLKTSRHCRPRSLPTSTYAPGPRRRFSHPHPLIYLVGAEKTLSLFLN